MKTTGLVIFLGFLFFGSLASGHHGPARLHSLRHSAINNTCANEYISFTGVSSDEEYDGGDDENEMTPVLFRLFNSYLWIDRSYDSFPPEIAVCDLTPPLYLLTREFRI